MKQKNNETMVANFVWRLFERIGAQSVSFIVNIVLARILAPEIYGTLALITVFTSIFQVFISSGIGTALIQKKDADDLDFSSAFYFNLILCFSLYLILFWSAPVIAMLYNNTELIVLIRVMGLMLVISSVKNIQIAYVSRKMIFKKFFFATIGGIVSSAFLGIVLAYFGFGIWALVVQQLVNNFVDVFILWITVPWRPQKIFSFERLRGLIKYAWKILVGDLIYTIFNDIRQLIIGKLYSSSDLAFYNRGKQFPNLLIVNVDAALGSVLLPAIARVQDKREQVRAIMRRTLITSCYVIMPMMFGMAVCAKTLVCIILTDKWLSCVPFMQIFCVAYMLEPIHNANINAIKAIGRSDLALKLEIIKRVIELGIIIVTMQISIQALAIGVLITRISNGIIDAFPNKKMLNYSWLAQIKDIMPIIFASLIMGGVVYVISFIPISRICILLIQILSGVVLYICLSKILKIESYTYICTMLKGVLNGRESKG